MSGVKESTPKLRCCRELLEMVLLYVRKPCSLSPKAWSDVCPQRRGRAEQRFWGLAKHFWWSVHYATDGVEL